MKEPPKRTAEDLWWLTYGAQAPAKRYRKPRTMRKRIAKCFGCVYCKGTKPQTPELKLIRGENCR